MNRDISAYLHVANLLEFFDVVSRRKLLLLLLLLLLFLTYSLYTLADIFIKLIFKLFYIDFLASDSILQVLHP
jgi:hypothetical protein